MTLGRRSVCGRRDTPSGHGPTSDVSAQHPGSGILGGCFAHHRHRISGESLQRVACHRGRGRGPDPPIRFMTRTPTSFRYHTPGWRLSLRVSAISCPEPKSLPRLRAHAGCWRHEDGHLCRRSVAKTANASGGQRRCIAAAHRTVGDLSAGESGEQLDRQHPELKTTARRGATRASRVAATSTSSGLAQLPAAATRTSTQRSRTTTRNVSAGQFGFAAAAARTSSLASERAKPSSTTAGHCQRSATSTRTLCLLSEARTCST